MKKLTRTTVALLLLLIPLIVLAAWAAIENFDSYTLAADLNTLNGGSNWSGAWSKAAGSNAYVVAAAPAGGQGGNSAKFVGSASFAQYDRSFTAISAGSLSVQGYIDTTAPTDVCSVRLRTGSTAVGEVWFDPDGHLRAMGSATDLGTYSASTWYTIVIDFDDAAQPDKMRFTVNGGTPSAWLAADNAYSTIGTLRLDGWFTNAAKICEWDDIKNASATATITPLVFFTNLF